jgi:hypothetical protein
LLRYGPAPWEQAPGPIQADSLLRAQRQLRLRLRPGCLGLPAQLMQMGGKVEYLRQAHGVRQPPGQRQRLLHALQRLVRIAQHPEGQRRQVTADHPRVLAIAHDTDAVLRRVVAGQALPAVRLSLYQLALPPGNIAPHPVPRRQDQWVVLLPDQPQKLLRQLPRPRQLSPRHMDIPEPPQRREQLRWAPHLPRQRTGPGIGALHLRGPLALSGPQRCPQHDLEGQFLLRPRVGLRQRAEHLQAPGHVADRFEGGGALERPLPGVLPVRHRLLAEARFRVVMGHQCGLGFGRLGKALR